MDPVTPGLGKKGVELAGDTVKKGVEVAGHAVQQGINLVGDNLNDEDKKASKTIFGKAVKFLLVIFLIGGLILASSIIYQMVYFGLNLSESTAKVANWVVDNVFANKNPTNLWVRFYNWAKSLFIPPERPDLPVPQPVPTNGPIVVVAQPSAPKVDFALVVKKYAEKFENRKFQIFQKMKEESDRDIWNHAIDSSEYFARRYYPEREKEDFFRGKIRQELLNDSAFESYVFSVAIVVDLEIKKLVLEILEESGIVEKGKAQGLTLPINFVTYTSKSLPSPEELAKFIYADLKWKGKTTGYADQTITKLYEKFVIQNPNCAISLEVFAGIVVGIISAPTGYGPAIGAGVAGLLEMPRALIESEFDSFKKEFQGGIFKAQGIFHGNLKTTIFNLFDAVYEMLSKNGKIEFIPPSGMDVSKLY